jgi:hypothetical protein
MKKLLLIACLILMSCGARKVDIEKVAIKKDSTAIAEVKVVTVETKQKTDSTNVSTTIDDNEITVTPIDTCKEIVVDGKIYKNVILKIKKTKTNSLYTNNKKESETKRIDSVATVKVNKTEDVVVNNKKIDKPANYSWIIWILLLILILYQLWRNRLSLLKLL